MIAAILAIVFFSPVAFIYGRYRARHLRARSGTLGSRLAALLPMPAFLAFCGVIAVIYQNEKGAAERLALRGESAPPGLLDTGNGVIDFALRLARWVGELELILFMVAAPFLLGAVIAAVLLVLDAHGTLALDPPVPDGEPDLPSNTDHAL